MNGAPTDLPASELTEPQPANAGWSWRKLILLILLAFLVHVALIFSFGTKKQIVPQAVKSNVPHLQLASRTDELIQLGNPALFALPNPRDFATAVWLKTPAVMLPSFRWTEAPRWLPLTGESLGAVFNQFMHTNLFETPSLNFKAPPQFILPVANISSGLPTNSTLQVSHGLDARQLLFQPPLPSLPLNDVVAPSRVRVLVDTTGNVLSAILLPSGNSMESAGRSDDADSEAMVLARTLRFKPAAQLTLGEVTFYWHTIPIPIITTNAP